MSKTIVCSDQAPAAIGSYSQAVRVADWLFLSGQIPLDPATGELVSGGVDDETRRVLTNIVAVLSAAGASLASVVKVTVYLTNISDFEAFNSVYRTFFAAEPPARSTVSVVALPRGARVELDAIAYLG